VEFYDEIANDIQRFGTDIEDFLDDKAYQRSTSFSIEQIGELVKRLSPDLTEEFNDVDLYEIAKMRDFVAHRYQHVVQQLLWGSMNLRCLLLRRDASKLRLSSNEPMSMGKVMGFLHRMLSAPIPELKLELILRLKLEPIKLKLDCIRYRLKG